MTYKASLDSLSKAITITIIVLAAIVPLSPFLTQSFRFEHLATPLLIIALEGALIMLCKGFSPQSYTLTQNALIINRSIQPPSFNLADITEIELIEAPLFGGIRTFGVGGIFGYFGKYWHPRYGNITLYATKSSNKILIGFRDHKQIMLTPDSLEMLNDLMQRIKMQG